MLTKRHVRWRLAAALVGPVGMAACGGAPRQEPVFCYRTLADVSCYQQPDQGRDEQLVGVYLRPAPPEGRAAGGTARAQAEAQAASDTEEPMGWFAGVMVASAELIGRVLTPVGPIVGLFR